MQDLLDPAWCLPFSALCGTETSPEEGGIQVVMGLSVNLHLLQQEDFR